MKKNINRYSQTTPKITTLLAMLGLLVLVGCNQEKADGTFLIVELENSENINQYFVFNPYIKSLDECRATAKTGIAQIFASDPMVIPKDSKVKSWRCSLMPPDRGG